MSKQTELVGLARTTNLDEVNDAYSAGALSNRNLIINGAMQVAQRGTSATGVTTNGYRTCDRFQLLISDMGAYTVTQESDAPAGFANSFKVNPTTADASPSAGDYLFVAHKLEGQNLQQLQKGTASAKPVTLSFWVKSYQTGTFQVNMRDEDNTRQIGATYNVNSSGVWEYKEITFSGDTTGAFDNDANESSKIEWWLDSGTNFSSGSVPSSWTSSSGANGDRNAGSTVNLANNTANYWQITGVQLEVGGTATPFEHRSYGDELERCQRYTYIISGAGYTPATSSAYDRYVMFGTGPTTAKWITTFPTTMRAVPSLITSNFTSSTVQIYSYTDDASKTLSSVSLDEGSINHQQVTFTISGSGLADTITWRWNNSPAAYIGFDAEL